MPYLIVEVLNSEPVPKVPKYKGTVLLHLEVAREVLPTISRGRKHNNTNIYTVTIALGSAQTVQPLPSQLA